MAGLIGQGISLHGIFCPDAAFPWNVSGVVTQADVGKAVSIDATADNTVKLAADGDTVLGILASYEDRKLEGIKVGTVYHQGGFQVPKTGALIVGASVVGAGSGVVKSASAANRTLVTAVDNTNSLATVVII